MWAHVHTWCLSGCTVYEYVCMCVCCLYMHVHMWCGLCMYNIILCFHSPPFLQRDHTCYGPPDPSDPSPTGSCPPVSSPASHFLHPLLPSPPLHPRRRLLPPGHHRACGDGHVLPGPSNRDVCLVAGRCRGNHPSHSPEEGVGQVLGHAEEGGEGGVAGGAQLCLTSRCFVGIKGAFG